MDVQELKARARQLVVKGRWEKAEVLYRQVLTQVPRDAPAWIRHAETLRRLGRTDDASWSYRTAAGILLSLGHETRAIAALKLALELKPDDIDLVSEIIRVEMHRNRREPMTPVQPVAGPEVVAMKDLQRKQLALPMLTEPDMRASAGSSIQVNPLASGGSGMFAAPMAAAPEPMPPPPAARSSAPGLDPMPRPGSSPVHVFNSSRSQLAAQVKTLTPAPQPQPQPPPDGVPLEVEARAHAGWPQVRRINDREVAIKSGPTSRWIVITASSPVDVRFADKLDIDAELPWLE